MGEINPEREGLRVPCLIGSRFPFGVRLWHARGANTDPSHETEMQFGNYPSPRPSTIGPPCNAHSEVVVNLQGEQKKRADTRVCPYEYEKRKRARRPRPYRATTGSCPYKNTPPAQSASSPLSTGGQKDGGLRKEGTKRRSNPLARLTRAMR
jgi:hypothetical protein